MLHCYNCGAEMPDNMLYCTRCGKKLDAVETETKVFGDGAAPTIAFGAPTQPVTQPLVVTKKKGGGLKAVLVVLLSLGLIGVILGVVGVMFWNFSKRQQVTVATNIANRSIEIPNVNINGITANANSAIDDAIKELQKAANDALAAANRAGNVNISSSKSLDRQTNRITFRPGATSSTSAGTIDEEATFVMRAKAGQQLSGRITAPGGCVKFEDDGQTLSLETDDGDNYLTVVNSCGKPSTMVLTITIK